MYIAFIVETTFTILVKITACLRQITFNRESNIIDGLFCYFFTKSFSSEYITFSANLCYLEATSYQYADSFMYLMTLARLQTILWNLWVFFKIRKQIVIDRSFFIAWKVYSTKSWANTSCKSILLPQTFHFVVMPYFKLKYARTNFLYMIVTDCMKNLGQKCNSSSVIALASTIKTYTNKNNNC